MKRVLIVDDDEDIRLGLCLLLEDSYQVLVAKNGAEALAQLDAGSVDLVVLDLMMPVMDGTGFMHGLASRGTSVPVIIISAHAQLSEKARDLRATAYLSKPFQVDALEALIVRVLSGPGSGGSGAGGPQGATGRGNGGGSSPWKAARPSLNRFGYWERLMQAWAWAAGGVTRVFPPALAWATRWEQRRDALPGGTRA